MALVRLPPHELLNSPSASEISTDNAEQLNFLETTDSEKERLHPLPPPRLEIYLILAKLALILILAISYLTFCFVVHYHTVPIGSGRSETLGLPFLHSEQYHF